MENILQPPSCARRRNLASAADAGLTLDVVFEAAAAETLTTSVSAPFVSVFFLESEAVSPGASGHAQRHHQSRIGPDLVSAARAIDCIALRFPDGGEVERLCVESRAKHS